MGRDGISTQRIRTAEQARELASAWAQLFEEKVRENVANSDGLNSFIKVDATQTENLPVERSACFEYISDDRGCVIPCARRDRRSFFQQAQMKTSVFPSSIEKITRFLWGAALFHIACYEFQVFPVPR